MRLAVLADIHGNLPALEAVLADAEQQGVDGYIVAGDLAYGPQMAEAIHRLRELGAWMIRGNNDQELMDYGQLPADAPHRYALQWACLRWQYAHLPADIRDLVDSLPEQRVVELPGTDPIRVVHGSPRRLKEMLFPQTDLIALRAFRQGGFLPPVGDPPSLDEPLGGVQEPVLVCGHTHIPWKEALDGCLALNPGSVGAPLNADPRAQYALLSWQGGCWRVEHRAVCYDLALLRTAFEESGLLSEGGAHARACLLWYQTGCNVLGKLIRHTYHLAMKAGPWDGITVPDEVYGHAVATFDWPDGPADV